MPKRHRAVRPRPAPRRTPTASVEEAHEALGFWLGRLERLPHRRRRARREARAMVARWEERHRDAVLARREATALGRVVVRAGLDALLAPPRAPGGPVERRRRSRALAATERGRRRRRRALLARGAAQSLLPRPLPLALPRAVARGLRRRGGR